MQTQRASGIIWCSCVVIACGLWLSTGNAILNAQQTWTDQSGKFQVTGTLVAFNSDIAIIKTEEDWLSMPVGELSQESREYLESEEGRAVHSNADWQKWTLKGGLQFVGRLVSHDSRDITLQRRRGKLYLDDRPVENLPAVYQKMLPTVIGQWEGQELKDSPAAEDWLYKRYGYRPKTYHCDGVRMTLETGDEYVFPYVLFADTDRKFLEKGGEEYRAATAEQQQNQALYTQVRADEYQKAKQAEALADAQRNQQLQEELQIKQVQLGLLGTAAGVTDIWQVAMIPPDGSFYSQQLVVVPARDSRQASQLASAKFPGYRVGAVQKLNRNH